MYYPVLVSSAILFALIVVNLHDKNNGTALIISLISIPILLFLTYLCQSTHDIFAYILILAPIFIIYLGYTMSISEPTVSVIPIIDLSGNIAPTPKVQNVQNVQKVHDRIEATQGSVVCTKCRQIACVCPNKV